MRIKSPLICIGLLASFAGSAFAANTVTFYRDGALYQQEAAAQKGVIDAPLAAGLLDHTLTIIPAPGTTILGVDTLAAGTAVKADKEIENLTEQRRRLEDRLQALETREAIFTSAAKAQSGKAPRKTKTNPDPMLTIRQGTDFAIAQLEAVYTARRTATQEIRKIDARLQSARKNSRTGESSVRITVAPPRGKVTLRYATSEPGWQPQYNLYLDGNTTTALLNLSARVAGGKRGYQLRVSPGSLTEQVPAEALTARPGSTLLASYRLPIAQERYQDGIYQRFFGTITNNGPHYLPPGESGLFRNGTYLGTFRFEGISSGRSKAISFGR